MLIKYNQTKLYTLTLFVLILLPLQTHTYSNNVNSRILTSFLTIVKTSVAICHITKRSPLLLSNTKCLLRCTTLAILFMLIMLLLIPATVHSQPLGKLSRDDQQNVPNRRYCSAALFEAIRLICNGRYNSLSNKYRRLIVFCISF